MIYSLGDQIVLVIHTLSFAQWDKSKQKKNIEKKKIFLSTFLLTLSFCLSSDRNWHKLSS